ncbi:signal peptidase I [Candidatus Woesearchaeota archaeon]|nr:signal peptidase I [Candidatus Woesearchaeota archaeon]MBT4935738.1 signal peptidase I [Candidatus Woesearchaeota archaeon]
MAKSWKDIWKSSWNFFWKSDSAASWIANVVVAFLVIRFLFYPLLAIILGTPFPIVAVVSESMEHGTHGEIICGQHFAEFPESFDNWWDTCGDWYIQNGITKEEFKKYPFKNGFNKGDVIVLWRANEDNLDIGDILVFASDKPQPIIHRVVKVYEEDDETFYQTKGDHNAASIPGISGEKQISQDRVYGQGLLRLPYLGWLKILFVDAVKPLGINIER